MRTGIKLSALLACGGNEESQMERGLTVDDEVASPVSEHELEMTEKQRQQQRIEEQE
jgi:hypothetical protein